MSAAIAQRYAQALFDMGEELSKIETLHHDLQKIHHLVEQSDDLKAFLSNPVVPAEKRQAILKDIFHGKIDTLTYKFILFLEAKRRLAHLKSICSLFDRLRARARGILRAQWSSSVELSPHDVHALTDYLKSKFDSREVEAGRHVDPGMLGGIKIQVDDTVYDYTLQAQLKKFKHAVVTA
ncbi:MAG TPA: ATP synthase F1 subunit delta [Candidatus Omnitrophica bacterium]|nr:ATP synthase F1 subunit delta [Candidatus Omnitrophota bacterium]HCI44117.1 ATP synthase F1 subunit delta [Candidatus Omnitrophota bacterium]